MNKQQSQGDALFQLLFGLGALALGYYLINWGEQTVQSAMGQLPGQTPLQLR
jgi:hypothetical protein